MFIGYMWLFLGMIHATSSDNVDSSVWSRLLKDDSLWIRASYRPTSHFSQITDSAMAFFHEAKKTTLIIHNKSNYPILEILCMAGHISPIAPGNKDSFSVKSPKGHSYLKIEKDVPEAIGILWEITSQPNHIVTGGYQLPESLKRKGWSVDIKPSQFKILFTISKTYHSEIERNLSIRPIEQHLLALLLIQFSKKEGNMEKIAQAVLISLKDLEKLTSPGKYKINENNPYVKKLWNWFKDISNKELEELTGINERDVLVKLAFDFSRDVDIDFLLSEDGLSDGTTNSEFSSEEDMTEQFLLGVISANADKNIEENARQAVHWYQEAAKQEYVPAQRNLGWMYAHRQGVDGDAEQTREEAIKWYKRAAEKGDAASQFALGVIYANISQNIEQNSRQAVYWYQEAAKQEYVPAQRNLGWMYANGKGVKKDDKEALKWYQKAAKQKDIISQRTVGNMYEYGNGAERDATKAVEWYQEAAKQGDAVAKCALGWMYYKGLGTEISEEKAIQLYLEAAEQDFAGAQYNLGEHYKKIQNLDVAKRWYQRAARQGHKKAQEALKEIENK